MTEPSDTERATWPDATREYVDYLERVLDAATRAYGALWRDLQTPPSAISREGRALLRDAIDIKHRRIGVEWAQTSWWTTRRIGREGCGFGDGDHEQAEALTRRRGDGPRRRLAAD